MKYKNYRNSYTNEDTIYSSKNIADMSVREAFSRKNEIMAQHNSIGIPSEGELKSSPNVIWVDAYTRDDGTEVRGYWRSRPEGSAENHSNDNVKSDDITPDEQGTVTGGARNMQNDLQDNIGGIILNKDLIDNMPSPTDESQGIAGVLKGEPMSIEQAGGGNVNPNYGNGDERYSKNCQACIGVFEARLRGYDIEALPYSKETHQFLEYHPEHMFINPETKLVEHFTDLKIYDNRNFEKWIDTNIKVGERYMLRFVPKQNKNDTHLVSVYKNANGKLIFNDVMTGKVHGIEFIKNCKYVIEKNGKKYKYSPSILRTDDKLLNVPMISKVSQPKNNSRKGI